MPTSKYSLDELARLAQPIYDQKVKPTLRPEDDSKFVAVDVDSGEFEIDADDYTAVMRLRGRMPDADIWLMRAGHRAAYTLGGGR